jgi:hypothetical protein
MRQKCSMWQVVQKCGHPKCKMYDDRIKKYFINIVKIDVRNKFLNMWQMCKKADTQSVKCTIQSIVFYNLFKFNGFIFSFL